MCHVGEGPFGEAMGAGEVGRSVLQGPGSFKRLEAMPKQTVRTETTGDSSSGWAGIT